MHLYFVTDVVTAQDQRSKGHRVLCADFADIRRHAESAGYNVTGDFVYVAVGEPETVPMDDCVALTKKHFSMLVNGNCLLVPAVRVLRPVPRETDTSSSIKARREVDFLMRCDVKIRKIPEILSRYKNFKLSRRMAEQSQMNLVFKDIEFLKETDGRHLALQYDGVPLDQQSQHNGAHLTATWVDDEGILKWHHLKGYITTI